MRFIRERVPSSARRLLDVGSGDGVRAMALARACAFETVVLSDVSAEMVQRCRALTPDRGMAHACAGLAGRGAEV